MKRIACVLLLVVMAKPGLAQSSAARQTEADDYTSYELLGPDTHQFHILYDVTATTPGAKYYFNVIRKGSVATDERVFDLATGQPLKFEVVHGADARTAGHPEAAADTDYIKVTLREPVPPNGGEGRIRIEKTYMDAKSYYRDGDTIVFERPLGIKRNKVVLPPGYELTGCNVPSQVFLVPDGRIAIAFINANPEAATLVVRARPLAPGTRTLPLPALSPPARPSEPTPAASTERGLEALSTLPVAERAFQDREIVYFLQEPDTHAFSLYHDYTESRPGVGTYLNVVRAGSKVSNPSAIELDHGTALKVETLVGRDALVKAGVDPAGEEIGSDTEVVVIRFPPVGKGGSSRLRISETYTDPARYGVVNGTLVWNRAFGRPRNAVVLPDGWFVTTSAAPTTVSLREDGRVQLEFVNGRPGDVEVLIRAAKRK